MECERTSKRSWHSDYRWLLSCCCGIILCGDLISFTLEGGIKLNCLVADEKNAGDSSGSVYGHWQDYPASGWSIIEWESMGGSDYSNSGALLNVSQWKGKKVTAAVNGGRYKGL